ncbi:hypothetical protein E2C01_038040 [Portunus trituberculatus]|uniref:Uncharacterized protein n=1 Tax=Portunus trituberculatus TaxID=210409 RepID=A0A5B7FFQ4_PORTR|nr:hypothetical protein [Portunus trituberculatus]
MSLQASSVPHMHPTPVHCHTTLTSMRDKLDTLPQSEPATPPRLAPAPEEGRTLGAPPREREERKRGGADPSLSLSSHLHVAYCIGSVEQAMQRLYRVRRPSLLSLSRGERRRPGVRRRRHGTLRCRVSGCRGFAAAKGTFTSCGVGSGTGRGGADGTDQYSPAGILLLLPPPLTFTPSSHVTIRVLVKCLHHHHHRYYHHHHHYRRTHTTRVWDGDGEAERRGRSDGNTERRSLTAVPTCHFSNFTRWS